MYETHKGKTSDPASSSIKIVEVMVCLAAVYSGLCTFSPATGGTDLAFALEWQPWLCPPIFLMSLAAQFLIASLDKVAPLKLSSASSYGDWITTCTLFLFLSLL